MQMTIANKVFAFLDGKDISDWIESFGHKCCYEDEDILVIDGKIKTTLNRNTDPVTITTCLCLALFGLNWIFVCPDILEIVDTKWKQRLGKKVKPKQYKNDWIGLIAKKAVEEGKLFELIFGEGRKLWQGFMSEEDMKKIVKEIL